MQIKTGLSLHNLPTLVHKHSLVVRTISIKTSHSRSFSALMQFVGCQKEYPECKKSCTSNFQSPFMKTEDHLEKV